MLMHNGLNLGLMNSVKADPPVVRPAALIVRRLGDRFSQDKVRHVLSLATEVWLIVIRYVGKFPPLCENRFALMIEIMRLVITNSIDDIAIFTPSVDVIISSRRQMLVGLGVAKPQ